MTNTDFKEYALKAINKMYRNDPWVRELYQAAGLQLQDIDELLNVLLDNGFFDAVGDRGLRVYEKDLGIKGDGTVEQRRAIVQMLWNNNGKCTLEKIKAIVKTFVLDDVEVEFEDGVLKLEFNNSAFVYAVPQIRRNLTVVKPSHIGLSIDDVHTVDTELYTGSVVTTFEVVNINPMTGFDSELDDAQIVAASYISIGNVINRINC
nr:MAG TPA: tail protein [Caudoviricetes sp.]